MRFFLISILFIFFSCSCTRSLKIDPQSAIDSNDLTAILSGCGQQLANSGYLICRQPQGQNTRETFLVVHTPPNLDCDGDACTYVKVFFPNGSPTLEKSIPKGSDPIRIPWNEIVNKDKFDLTDRGFYAVSVTTHFKGPNGEDMRTYASGMVFMHVVRKEYTSLYENENDEYFKWAWKTEKNQMLKVTTGYRVYVEPYPATPKE
jgi:hypothetical protein